MYSPLVWRVLDCLWTVVPSKEVVNVCIKFVKGTLYNCHSNGLPYMLIYIILCYLKYPLERLHCTGRTNLLLQHIFPFTMIMYCSCICQQIKKKDIVYKTGNENLEQNVETKIYPPYIVLRLVQNRGSTSENPPYEIVSLQGIDHSISFYIDLSSVQKGMFCLRTYTCCSYYLIG